MFLTKAKDFLAILNTDALLFLGTRIASIVFSIASVILLCQAVTEQRYFLTDGLGVMYDLIPLGSVSPSLAPPQMLPKCITDIVFEACLYPGLVRRVIDIARLP